MNEIGNINQATLIYPPLTDSSYAVGTNVSWLCGDIIEPPHLMSSVPEISNTVSMDIASLADRLVKMLTENNDSISSVNEELDMFLSEFSTCEEVMS